MYCSRVRKVGSIIEKLKEMLEEYLKKTKPKYYPPVENLLDLVIDVYSIGFCHFYHCVHDSAGLGSVWCIAEQPVFTAYCKRADRIFAEIIRKTAAAVFQIGGQIGAAILNVGDSFIHSASTDRALLIKPRQKAFYYRLSFFKTNLFDSIEGRIPLIVKVVVSKK